LDPTPASSVAKGLTVLLSPFLLFFCFVGHGVRGRMIRVSRSRGPRDLSREESGPIEYGILNRMTVRLSLAGRLRGPAPTTRASIFQVRFPAALVRHHDCFNSWETVSSLMCRLVVGSTDERGVPPATAQLSTAFAWQQPGGNQGTHTFGPAVPHGSRRADRRPCAEARERESSRAECHA